jgi:hypothetical protein
VRLRGSYSFWLDVRVPEPEHLRAEKVRLPRDILDRLSRLEHVCEAVLCSAGTVGGGTRLVLTVLDHLYYRHYAHSNPWLQREPDRDVRAASGYLRLADIGDLQGGPEGPVTLYVKVGGYLILATAAAAWYVAAADAINGAFGRTVFPLERVGKRTVNL